MNATPLAGIFVLDLTRILAGPYATMLLADLGARVVKIELPGQGDDTREVGPFIEHETGGRTSAYFASVNRNKESIALDLKVPADRGIFEKLLERADVLVENFRPGVMDKLGYLCEAIERRELPSDARFASNGERTRHHAELKLEIEAALRSRTATEWVVHLRARGIACGPVNDVAALRGDPQLQARQMLVDLPLPGGGTLAVAGCPIRFADSSHAALFRPAPTLDQHRSALLAELGLLADGERDPINGAQRMAPR